MINRYKIAYNGLASGDHSFDFQVDGALFKRFSKVADAQCNEQDDYDEVLSADCSVHVELLRNETFLRCSVSIEGSVDMPCDRCLEPCGIPIEVDSEFTVKFSDESELSGEWDGEVMWLPTSEGELDLAHYIYETIILSLPYQRVHPDGECNADMMKRFRAISSEELEKMEQQAQEQQEDAKGLNTDALAKLAQIKQTMIDD